MTKRQDIEGQVRKSCGGLVYIPGSATSEPCSHTVWLGGLQNRKEKHSIRLMGLWDSVASWKLVSTGYHKHRGSIEVFSFVAHFALLMIACFGLPNFRRTPCSSSNRSTPFVSVVMSWSMGISAFRLCGEALRSSNSFWSAVKIMLVCATSQRTVAAFRIASFRAEMAGARISTTLPPAAMRPMMAAATSSTMMRCVAHSKKKWGVGCH